MKRIANEENREWHELTNGANVRESRMARINEWRE
jgi:hypothetical protein